MVLDRRYRIERKLGEGGMGMVYLGVHERTGRKCAVKLLPPEAAQDPGAVQRFEREARVLGALGHPGIVGIHDFSETPDGRPFFVMDHLEGEDLAERLKRVGRLDWPDTQKVVDEISAALWAAHQAGVLHRDLKPGNVFLAQSPAAPERVVLLDFGLAKGGITDALTLTQSNMVMGTPLYMSPEQARSVGVDSRSDIYSLAALTFELLAGQPPFVGPNYTAVLASLLTDPPPKLSEKATAAVPEHLDEVLDIALSKNPEDRQPDVASFATAVLQRRPAWADTTVETIESGLIPRVGAGVATGASSNEATGPPSNVATGPPSSPVADSASMQLAVTVASSPSIVAPPAPYVAPSGTSEPALPRASTPPLNITPEPALNPRVSMDPAPTPVGTRAPERRKRSKLLPVVLVLVALGMVGAVAAYWMSQRATTGSAKGANTQAAATVAADASAESPLSSTDAGEVGANTPDAEAVAGGPDGGRSTGAETPLEKLVNKKLKQLTGVIEGLPEKGLKATKKVIRKAIKDASKPRPRPRTAAAPVKLAGAAERSPPARRAAAWTPPAGLKGVQLLAAYMKRRDFAGCARAARKMGTNPSVLQLGVACAVNANHWSTARVLCNKLIASYPTSRLAQRCYGILKALDYKKKQEQKNKKLLEYRRKMLEKRKKMRRRRN